MKRGFVFPGVRGEAIEVEPGIYQNVPFEDYLAWNAISNSSMSAAVAEASPLAISMCDYKHQEPLEEKPPLRFGRWAHAAKFEFMKAIEDYDVMPDLTRYKVLDDGSLIEDPCKNKDGKTVSQKPKSTDEYTARVTAYKARPDKIGKIFVEPEEAEAMAAVLFALDHNERSREYFANNNEATDRELSIVWIDAETGLKCKARIDCVQHALRMTVDLKTVEKISAFEKLIAKWNWHRQGAWYTDGFKALTGEQYRHAIVGAEKKRHGGVIAAPLGFAAVSTGRSQYREVLNRIAVSIESGNWPALESPPEFSIPAWAIPNRTAVTDGVLTSW